MNERAEKFRQQLQKELGLTVGPKDPILAEWLAQEEFRKEIAAEHQRMLVAFEEALTKNQANWSESAKKLANQSLNAALGAARENIAALSEEAARTQAAAFRGAAERAAERLESAGVRLARLSWLTFATAIIAFAAALMLLRNVFCTKRRASLFLALFPIRPGHLLSDVFSQISKLLIFLRR